MSEPVSKAEIEDVLSSIRRLVSENTGAIKRESDGAEAAEKLVLTPAFRVDQEEGDTGAVELADKDTPEAMVAQVVDAANDDDAAVAAEADAAAQGADAAHEPVQAEDDGHPLSPLERRIAELESVISRSASEFEPEATEVEEIAGGYAFPHEATETDTQEPEGEAEAEADADAGADMAEPGQAEDVAEVSAEAEMALDAVVELVPEPVAEPEAETVVELQPEAMVEPEPEAMVQPEPEPVVEPEAEAVAEPEPEQDAAVEAEPAQEWEDVAATMAAADSAEDAEAWGEEVYETGPEAAAAPDHDDTEAVIDEEALREMVARMVREELQGSVGERITHNVRRMVRREIARALSLQNFE